MATCSASELVEAAECFACLSKQQLQAVIAQLLCDINANGGGGGGGGATQVFSGHYGAGTPSNTPTASAALAYNLDSPYQIFAWDGSAWA